MQSQSTRTIIQNMKNVRWLFIFYVMVDCNVIMDLNNKSVKKIINVQLSNSSQSILSNDDIGRRLYYPSKTESNDITVPDSNTVSLTIAVEQSEQFNNMPIEIKIEPLSNYTSVGNGATVTTTAQRGYVVASAASNPLGAAATTRNTISADNAPLIGSESMNPTQILVTQPDKSPSSITAPLSIHTAVPIRNTTSNSLRFISTRDIETIRLCDAERAYHGKAQDYSLKNSRRKLVSDANFGTYSVPRDDDRIVLLVRVSRHGTRVHMDGRQIYSNCNHTAPWTPGVRLRLHAGLHVLVLCPVTRRLLRAVNLMTWQKAAADRAVAEITSVNKGRIILLIGAPDFIKELTISAREVMAGIGSDFIEQLVQYDSFVMASTVGGSVLFEAVRPKYAEPTWQMVQDGVHWDGTPMTIEVIIQSKKKDRCAGVFGLQGDHKLFCERYEGYGDFCACNSSVASYAAQQEDHNSSSPVIAVALVGGIRLPQVLEQIRTILANTGGHRVPMVMCLDGGHQEAEQLASLFNVTVAIFEDKRIKEGTLSRINFMIQFAVSKVFELTPKAEFAIILEDDIQLSPDFMPYFRQTSELLATDSEMLLCVNAYNSHSYPETSGNYSRLFRHEGTPAYGWMITRAVGKEMEEIDYWPGEYNLSDWDFYFRGVFMGGRHVVAPDVPRSRHVSAGGVHITGMEQHVYYNRRTFNQDRAYVLMDIKSVEKNRYITHHLSAARQAVQLNLTQQHPCQPNITDGFPAGTAFIVYLDLPDERDQYRALEVATKCLGNYDKGNHDHLLMMYLIYPHNRPLYLVGCPNSQFCTQRQGAPDHYYRPSTADVALAQKTYYLRVPLVTQMSFRRHSREPWDEFVLNNIFEYTRGVYVF